MPVSDCVHASLNPQHHGAPSGVLFLCHLSEACPGHRVSLGVRGAIAWSGGHVAFGVRGSTVTLADRDDPVCLTIKLSYHAISRVDSRCSLVSSTDNRYIDAVLQ
jgi:hypothetical protein